LAKGTVVLPRVCGRVLGAAKSRAVEGASTRGESPLRERHAEVAGVPVFWREADPVGDAAPVLYVHGVPTNADDYTEFLERTGGVALDLPGFGRSGKPGGFEYSIGGYRKFLGTFVDHLGLDRFSLVVHDWGAVGLALAQDRPQSLERLVISNAAPLLPGYRWHWIARIWRRRVLGELFMGVSSRWGFKQLSRQATVAPGPAPDELIDRVWAHFDHGTQRAILRLYRSAPPEVLAEAGRGLSEIHCPALVLWGAEDPYIPTGFAKAYAEALGGPVSLELADGAGHWPWIDRPELVDTVVGFLLGGDATRARTDG
jgi:pimeloyl-ACP methyl ester carboxylesterase